MFWYSTGWFWWWLAFIAIFFLLPLGYGWGYRGWGPWYRLKAPERRSAARDDYAPQGWGALAVFLWLVVIIAAVWLAAVLIFV